MLEKIRSNRLYYSLFMGSIALLSGLVMYPLIDYIWTKIDPNRVFIYSLRNHVISPIILGAVYGFVIFLLFNYRNKQK